MSETENRLLNMIRVFASAPNQAILQDALYALSQENSEKKFFAKLLTYFIIGNKFLDDNSLLFKEIICQQLLDVLEHKDYSYIYVLSKFMTVKNENFKKIMNFSMLLYSSICKSTQTTRLNILFYILINKYFSYIKDILNGFKITCFNNNKELVYIICKNKLSDLNGELDKKEGDFTKFLNLEILTIDEQLDFFNGKFNLDNILTLSSKNENNKNEINEQRNLKSNDNSKININITNTLLNEEINNKKIIELNEDRTKRIEKLINNSITIKNNEILKEDDILNINYNKINDNSIFNLQNIIIDDYQIKNKENLYLFSPISLLINGIKKNFEINDFEIFNKDNHYIELFGNYLKEIIIKLNDYINNGNEEKYIFENRIKFGRYKKHFYLCCKFNEAFKDEYYKNINIYKNNRISNEKNKETKKIKVINEKDEENQKEGVNKTKNNNKAISTYSIGRYSLTNDNSRKAHKLENDIKEIIAPNKNNELQNLLFFFNLKIPKKNLTIEFESATLFFNSFYDSLYGFREIDICSINSQKITLPENIFENNYSFVFNKDKFDKTKTEMIDVTIESNKIIFCEIKNSFPHNITSGYENTSKIKINDNEINNNENNYSITFKDQLENLLKKAKLFYSFFENEGIKCSMHILYIYDKYNIIAEESNNNICSTIEECLTRIDFNHKFNQTIFQMVYFNKKMNKKNNQEESINKIKKEIAEKIQKENKETIEKIQKENKETIEKIQKENKETIDKIQKENEENINYIEKLKKASEDNKDLLDILAKLKIIPK